METADRKRGEIVGKTELAKAYVQIIPSAKGIGGMLQNEVGGETDAAGNRSEAESAERSKSL